MLNFKKKQCWKIKSEIKTIKLLVYWFIGAIDLISNRTEDDIVYIYIYLYIGSIGLISGWTKDYVIYI